MREALISRHGLDADTAARLSHEVRGSYTEALAILQSNDDEQQFFDQFVLLMRQAWARDIRGMMEQSRVMRSWGREKLRNFITYCLRLVRENFVYNFRIPSLTYMSQKEEKFATRFARFINERNVIPIARSMQRLGDDIAQNANAEIAFFDFSMKMIILIHR
jgi:DNA polymerase-3 subunit delta'